MILEQIADTGNISKMTFQGNRVKERIHMAMTAINIMLKNKDQVAIKLKHKHEEHLCES